MNLILQGMAERLSQPEHWTRFTGARDANDSPVPAIDPEATCWCIIGARTRAVQDAGIPVDARDASRRLTVAIRTHWPTRPEPSDESPNEVIASFNDHPETTHADVVRLLELAQQ